MDVNLCQALGLCLLYISSYLLAPSVLSTIITLNGKLWKVMCTVTTWQQQLAVPTTGKIAVTRPQKLRCILTNRIEGKVTYHVGYHGGALFC